MIPKTLALTFFAASLLAAEPEKLTKLRGSYESAMTKATAPIQKTYTTELEKLKIEFTKAGRLEDALAVTEEIKKISGVTSPPKGGESPDKTKVTDWLTEKGGWLAGTTAFLFLPNGTGTKTYQGSEFPLTWKIGDDLVVTTEATDPNGKVSRDWFILRSSREGDVYGRLPSDPQAKKSPIIRGRR